MQMEENTNRLLVRRTDILFVLLLGVIFVKLLLFTWSAYHVIYISSFITNLAAFLGWYMPKIAAAIWIALIIYLLKVKWWWGICSAIFDIWIIANLLYLRSYEIPLDAYALSIVDNMDGFWSSVLPLFRWSDAIYPFLTSICFLLTYLWNDQYKSWFKALFIGLFALMLNTGGRYLYIQSLYGYEWAFHHTHIQCFSVENRLDVYGVDNTRVLKETSLLHTLGYSVWNLVTIQVDKRSYELSDSEKKACAELFSVASHQSDMLLIMIIVESFDSWVLTDEYMPHLSAFIKNHPCFVANRVKSQVRGGMSADGQMIINTGLLPIAEGATCYRFPNNVYPGIMRSLSGESKCILPHKKDVWNQGLMSQAYGYTSTIESIGEDSILFDEIIHAVNDGYQGVQMLTLSTHSPYDFVNKRSSLKLSSNYDKITQDYIKSFNFFDSQLNKFLELVDVDTVIHQATILITGDHAAPYPIKKAYCPLIIYSPNITSSIVYNDECYQMDIYPTIVSVVNASCEWKGLGIDLMDSLAVRTRTEDSLYVISDKLIRANYFSIPIEERLCVGCQ